MVEEHQVEEQQKKMCRENLSRQLRARADCLCHASIWSGRSLDGAWRRQHRVTRLGVVRMFFHGGNHHCSPEKSPRKSRSLHDSIRLPVAGRDQRHGHFCRDRVFSIRHFVAIGATTWRPPSGSGFETRKQVGFVIGDDVGRTEAPPQILIQARRKALASQRVNCRRRRRIAID